MQNSLKNSVTTKPWTLFTWHLREHGEECLAQASLFFSDERLLKLREETKASFFILKTCNRIELLTDKESSLDDLVIPQPQVYRKLNEILRHFLEVALSMDSLVFGESQILGQMKRALDHSLEQSLASSELKQLFDPIFREAKAIRSEGELAHVQTSLSAVAAREFLPFLREHQRGLLLVGAGETHQLMARWLKKRDFKHFYWVNRTFERAKECSEMFGGEVIPWSHLSEGILPEVSVVSLATDAGHVVLDAAALKKLNPRHVYDLSLPANALARDVESVGAIYHSIACLESALSQEKKLYEELVGRLNKKVEASLKRLNQHFLIRQQDHVVMAYMKDSEEAYKSLIEAGLNEQFSHLNSEDVERLRGWSEKLYKSLMFQNIKAYRRSFQENS